MRARFFTAAVTAGLVLGGTSFAAEASRLPTEPTKPYNFGALPSVPVAVAKAQAAAWLQSVGKTDPASQQAFESIWSASASETGTTFDRVIRTLELGNPAVGELLADARDLSKPAPTTVPELILDPNQPSFLRANLAIAFAKTLASRRVYEEGLEALASVKVEETVEPATYLFHRAVAEHALMNRAGATRTILRLLDDAPDAPERYKMVASLMFVDMQSWKEGKDLGNIARLMDNSERRLDLARGGKQTQDIQKKIVFRLDELIKEKENQAKAGGGGGGGGGGQQAQGQCPDGGQSKPGNSNQPSSPQTDSMGGSSSGKGIVDEKKLREYAEKWGTLPEKEKVRAMAELTRGLPPRYREIIENYFKTLARTTP
jgi:hypothetical protein